MAWQGIEETSEWGSGMSERSTYERLADPFPIEHIHWRVGSTNKKAYEGGKTKTRRGMPLAYIDARDVMDRLDAVCGPEGWQDEYIDTGNGATCCKLSILVGKVWVAKSDGAGRTDYEGDKGQFSDAFKRAAVKHGIGRYLYGHSTGWIELDDYWNIPPAAQGRLSKSLAEWSGVPFATNAGSRDLYSELEKEIRTIGNVTALEKWGAANAGRIKGLPKDWQDNIRDEWTNRKAELEKEKAA